MSLNELRVEDCKIHLYSSTILAKQYQLLLTFIDYDLLQLTQAIDE